MNNKKIYKIKINYEDGTDKTMGADIQRVLADNKWFVIRETIYVDKEISTIDIISKDETQTYLTINVNDLEVGKYYTLSESLRIE